MMAARDFVLSTLTCLCTRMHILRTPHISTTIVRTIVPSLRVCIEESSPHAVKMQRKNYSLTQPIPRQTLWNQKQRAKKAEAVSLLEGDQQTLDSFSHEGNAEERLQCPKQKKKRVEGRTQPVGDDQHPGSSLLGTQDTEDPCEDYGQSLGSSLLGMQHTEDPPSINDSLLRDKPCMLAEQSAVSLVPRMKPVIYKSDDEEVHSLSDDGDELFGNSRGRNSDSMSSSSGEESDSLRSGKESGSSSDSINRINVGNEFSAPWLLPPNQPMECAGPSKEELPSCPPEVKYSALVHMLRTKHGLTKEAVDDTMEILNDLSMLTLNKPVVPKDARTLQKTYEPYLTAAEKHFLCACGAYVGIQNEGAVTFTCQICGFLRSFKNTGYFFYLPLADQLRQLFEYNYEEVSVAFSDCEKKDDTSHLISGIRDGRKYKEYLDQMNGKGKCISLTFSCDGVPVFSSSGSSLWPCLCTINELDMPLRKKKHVLVAAVFYGVEKKKPDMNQVLLPLVAEALILHTRGFQFYCKGVEETCRATFLIGLADSVGRVLLLMSTQFNGEFGCSVCLHPGLQVSKGRGTVRVYPHRDDVAKRTSAETKDHAKVAILNDKPCKGIKGETILSVLPLFDVIYGLVPDYMHSSVLGTPRQLSKLWLKPKYNGNEFYIGNAKDSIDERLQNIQPPFYVSRMPRKLKDIKFWKAHEWYVWTLVYSVPVLKGILPNQYMRHWMLFVEAMFLLTQENIAKSQVFNAKELLVQFTRGVETLYGLEHCSFNVHLGEHLGDSVLDWGPLPEHSGFLYEDFMQVILKTIHSSKGVLEQVVNQIRCMRSIPSLLATPVGMAFLDLNVAKKERLLSTTNSISCVAKSGVNALVLCPQLKCISDDVRLTLAGVLDIVVPPRKKVLFSERIIFGKEVFHSKDYKVVKKRNSYTVLLNDGRVFSVDRYIVVSDSCYALGRYLQITKNFKFVSDRRDNLPGQICVKKDRSNLCAVDVSEFVCKVVYMECRHLNVNVVCIPPNRIEVLK